MQIGIIFDAIIFASILFYIILCPYTKVEESFNMQAMHDILYYGTDLNDYDHHVYPGVVPRTFLGSIFITSIVFPFKFVVELLTSSKLCLLYLCRIAIALMVTISFIEFRKSICQLFGRRCGVIWALFISLQFHLPFYSSRSLPNVFALAICVLAYSIWFKVSFIVVYFYLCSCEI